MLSFVGGAREDRLLPSPLSPWGRLKVIQQHSRSFPRLSSPFSHAPQAAQYLPNGTSSSQQLGRFGIIEAGWILDLQQAMDRPVDSGETSRQKQVDQVSDPEGCDC